MSLRIPGVHLTDPHPYRAFGAPYGDICPWQARGAVVDALKKAKAALEQQRPDLGFRLFDAYRPNAIQSFMVGHEFRMLSGGKAPDELPPAEAEAIFERAYRIWAEPSEDDASPPPHSTGAALDLTLCDAEGHDISMGSPIDENSDCSLPDYFERRDPLAHANRKLLKEVMESAGFERHPEEWWHFSLGDQMWAWTREQKAPSRREVARYGRADRL